MATEIQPIPNKVEAIELYAQDERWIKKIAAHLELSTEDIHLVESSIDVSQAKKSVMARVSAKYPKGTRLMWAPSLNMNVFYLYINKNLSRFGFAKLLVPQEDGTDEIELIVYALPKVQSLF